MAELTDEEYEAATERGRVLFETEPHVRNGRYDVRSGMTTVELYDGCTFAFPQRRLQGCEQGGDEHLQEVDVIGVEYGSHRETLDADRTVKALMAGRFGSAAFMERGRRRLRDMPDVPRHHAA